MPIDKICKSTEDVQNGHYIFLNFKYFIQMKSIVYAIGILLSLVLFSCNSEPTLQKYFVEHSEKKDFVALDVSSGVINVDKTKLSAEQKTALESFDKMNILIFKEDGKNASQYEKESKEVAKLLKSKDYSELIKIGSGSDMASISFVGNEDDIDEFVLFAKKKDNGFGIVRILGNDMNPNNIINMISVLKDSQLNMEQLKPLQDLIKK
ncbi:hypothetical protein GCM10011508_24230 [Flavobacterium lutivivi]|nr:hypothetical protein GCM10011508_24230 [Flavobacterium lutivivi]